MAKHQFLRNHATHRDPVNFGLANSNRGEQIARVIRHFSDAV
jgi:hypothetical protein